MKAVVLILLIALILAVGAVSAANTTVLNVTEKTLTITQGSVPNFFGVIKTNTTSIYVTGEQSSLSKTLALLNGIELGANNTVTETSGIISAVT